MIKTVITNPGERITEEELKKFDAEVRDAQSRPIVFDEDCSELSPAMIKAFRSASALRNRVSGK